MTFRTKLLIALLITGVIRGLYNVFIPLHPDEAYYWLWSRYIDWSYYDHPGMTAWMIRLLSFAGDSEGAVRLTAVFCMTGAGYALSMLSYKIKGENAGWLCFIAFASLPATAMGYAFVTPDSPLILFWCLSLYWGLLAVTGEGKRYFIMTGVAIALMITGKYTAVLFPASLFFYILLFDRSLFRDKYTWLACLIGMCGIIPIVIWNMQHDWISIKFQYQHGTSKSFRILWDEFLILLGGIQLLPTPVFAFIIYKVSFYFKGYRKEQWFKYIFTIFLVPTLFFLYKGLFRKMELNWPVIGFLSALSLLAVYVADGYHRKLYKTGIVFAAAATAIMMMTPFLPLPDKINISRRLLGYKEAVEELSAVAPPDAGTQYFSNHLTVASIMAYYLKGHPRVYIPVNSRYSQFDIWDSGADYSGMKGYYLGFNDKGEELANIFGGAELIKEFSTISRKFYIYKTEPAPLLK
ncbi:MAG: glycosyltransferase family 39 protein [Deferribacteraceae bacterium]|jgi:4-amino-4-deoxy-L-arabinose transferase-like glycosyltransferase|nr:glycosyltransferase family 39 protein [Deferribacteraceae bacterium]